MRLGRAVSEILSVQATPPTVLKVLRGPPCTPCNCGCATSRDLVRAPGPAGGLTIILVIADRAGSLNAWFMPDFLDGSALLVPTPSRPTGARHQPITAHFCQKLTSPFDYMSCTSPR